MRRPHSRCLLHRDLVQTEHTDNWHTCVLQHSSESGTGQLGVQDRRIPLHSLLSAVQPPNHYNQSTQKKNKASQYTVYILYIYATYILFY